MAVRNVTDTAAAALYSAATGTATTTLQPAAVTTTATLHSSNSGYGNAGKYRTDAVYGYSGRKAY